MTDENINLSVVRWQQLTDRFSGEMRTLLGRFTQTGVRALPACAIFAMFFNTDYFASALHYQLVLNPVKACRLSALFEL